MLIYIYIYIYIYILAEYFILNIYTNLMVLTKQKVYWLFKKKTEKNIVDYLFKKGLLQVF